MRIGVDIGGTKVAAGLVDLTGAITHKVRVPMLATGDAATGFGAVAAAIEAVFSGAGKRARRSLESDCVRRARSTPPAES